MCYICYNVTYWYIWSLLVLFCLGDTKTVELAFSFWNNILRNFSIYIYWWPIRNINARSLPLPVWEKDTHISLHIFQALLILDRMETGMITIFLHSSLLKKFPYLRISQFCSFRSCQYAVFHYFMEIFDKIILCNVLV